MISLKTQIRLENMTSHSQNINNTINDNNDVVGPSTSYSMRKSRGLYLFFPLHFDKNFQCRFFANRVVDALIDAGLGLNDFYYDIKEHVIDSPLRCSSRMRAAEQCSAAIVFLLWPNNTSSTSQEPQQLLSVNELAELSVLCVRSMSPEADAMTNKRPSPSSSSLIKLYIVCQDGAMNASLLPSSLDFTLSGAQHYPCVRMAWSPCYDGLTTSQLREMAGAVCSELLSVGVSDWCRTPTALPSRAAWLSTASTAHNSKVPSASSSGREDQENNEGDDEDVDDSNNVFEKPQLQKPKETWRNQNPLDWTPAIVQDFLDDIKVPPVIAMRIDELSLDGSELSIMSASDFNSHILIDNTELCKILLKKIRHQMSPHSLDELAYDNGKRQLTRIYLVFDPRDAKLASQLRKNLEKLHFEVLQHGPLGHSRSEFALTQLPRIARCAFFVVLLTETAVISPFVWEEVCLIRSIIKPPASAIVALSWNIGASIFPNDMLHPLAPPRSQNLKQIPEGNEEVPLPLPSLILLLADAQNVPLLVQNDVAGAITKASRIIETAVRSPPPGIMLATPINNEFADILAPNSGDCDSLLFQPRLSSIASPKMAGRYGYLISNFLPSYETIESGGPSIHPSLIDQRMQLLNLIYIAPPMDIVVMCDWAEGRNVALPLLATFRSVGLRCFADFENPLLTTQTTVRSGAPKARLRLLLLTTSSGHLPSSHPLVSTAMLDSAMSPLVFVLCSRSPIASPDELPPSKSAGPPGVISVQPQYYYGDEFSQYSSQSVTMMNYQQNYTSSNNNTNNDGSSPTALLLDMSSSRGIARFVNAVCRYLGYHITK